ncbi:MAG: GNAT family N-acetyltransferase [Methanomassiliicoccales archaeon]|nr:MAG: GNAT family N-acetyltransferase [Methanomassiliicoccales archaeon]
MKLEKLRRDYRIWDISDLKNMKITDSLDKKKWLEFVEKNSSGNIFHTPYMMELYENTRKYEPIILAAVDGKEDDILSLILSVRVRVIGGIPGRLASCAIIFGGVLCDDSEAGRRSLNKLFEYYDRSIKHKVLFTEIRNIFPTDKIKKHLEAGGWNYEQYNNYLIDLRTSQELIFQSFSKSLRRNIRKAKKNGIIVEQIEDKGQLPIFYRMLRETYSKAKVSLADISLFESAFDSLQPRKMVNFFLTRLGDNYTAGRAVLSYKGSIFDWYACMNRDYAKFYPNEMLVWHILNWGIENGFHTFDFGGAGRPDQKYGVGDFKARFNGRFVNHGRYMKIHCPNILRFSRKCYEVYRRFL